MITSRTSVGTAVPASALSVSSAGASALTQRSSWVRNRGLPLVRSLTAAASSAVVGVSRVRAIQCSISVVFSPVRLSRSTVGRPASAASVRASGSSAATSVSR